MLRQDGLRYKPRRWSRRWVYLNSPFGVPGNRNPCSSLIRPGYNVQDHCHPRHASFIGGWNALYHASGSLSSICQFSSRSPTRHRTTPLPSSTHLDVSSTLAQPWEPNYYYYPNITRLGAQIPPPSPPDPAGGLKAADSSKTEPTTENFHPPMAEHHANDKSTPESSSSIDSEEEEEEAQQGAARSARRHQLKKGRACVRCRERKVVRDAYVIR